MPHAGTWVAWAGGADPAPDLTCGSAAWRRRWQMSNPDEQSALSRGWGRGWLIWQHQGRPPTEDLEGQAWRFRGTSRSPCLQRHLAHSLFPHWGVLCPLLLLSAVWEDTYESFTLQCELAHQTPADSDGYSPIIAPGPWAGIVNAAKAMAQGVGGALDGPVCYCPLMSRECAEPCHGCCAPVVSLNSV